MKRSTRAWLVGVGALAVVFGALLALSPRLRLKVTHGSRSAGREWREWVDGRSRWHVTSGDARLIAEYASAYYDPVQRALIPVGVDRAQGAQGVGMLRSYHCRVFLDLDGDRAFSEHEPTWLWDEVLEGASSLQLPSKPVELDADLVGANPFFAEWRIELDDRAGFTWEERGSNWLQWFTADPIDRLMRAVTGD